METAISSPTAAEPVLAAIIEATGKIPVAPQAPTEIDRKWVASWRFCPH